MELGNKSFLPTKKRAKAIVEKDRDHLVLERQTGESRRYASADEDWQLFFSIQMERYLKRKVQKRFCSEVEKDVIRDIIMAYWSRLKENIPEESCREAKIRLFYKFVLVFPYFVAEEEMIIPVDFSRRSSINSEKQCICGSNIPYYDCCGRIPDADDLMNGSF